MQKLVLGLTTLSLGLLACGTDLGTEDPPPDPTPRATWYQDVAPIVSKHCMSCHQDGGIAPFSLTEYEDARDNATRMVDQITKGTMPPFDAREEADCTPRFSWKDDPRLSDQEITTIDQWIQDGRKSGTLADVPKPASTDLPGVTQTLKPVVPFTSSGDRDQFICYVLDPAATAVTWLTGLQVRPGNADVVHHVVIGEMTPGADLDATVAAHGIGMPWDCSNMATPGGFIVSLWTPGNQPMQTPSELAVPILAGSKLVMQLHYHPAGGIHDPDATSLDLRTSTAWPQKMYFVGAFGNAVDAAHGLQGDPDDRVAGTPEFRIPANNAAHTEKMRITVPDLGTATNVRLYSANPHMHLIGTHLSGKIERQAPLAGEPANECLANGNWNFDWQRTYIYDAPLEQLPSVHSGDVIEVSCTWNNTMENPFVERSLEDAGLVAPVDVTLGEGGSTDEMCLEIFGIAIDAPPMPAARTVGTPAPTLSVDQLPMQLLSALK